MRNQDINPSEFNHEASYYLLFCSHALNSQNTKTVVLHTGNFTIYFLSLLRSLPHCDFSLLSLSLSLSSVF